MYTIVKFTPIYMSHITKPPIHYTVVAPLQLILQGCCGTPSSPPVKKLTVNETGGMCYNLTRWFSAMTKGIRVAKKIYATRDVWMARLKKLNRRIFIAKKIRWWCFGFLSLAT